MVAREHFFGAFSCETHFFNEGNVMESFELTKNIGMLIYRDLSLFCDEFGEKVKVFELSSNYLRSCINDKKLWSLFEDFRKKTNELLHLKLMCAVLGAMNPEKKSELLMTNKYFFRREKEIRHFLAKIKATIIDEEMEYYNEYEKDYNVLVSFIENNAGKFLNVFINDIYRIYQ